MVLLGRTEIQAWRVHLELLAELPVEADLVGKFLARIVRRAALEALQHDGPQRTVRRRVGLQVNAPELVREVADRVQLEAVHAAPKRPALLKHLGEPLGTDVAHAPGKVHSL